MNTSAPHSTAVPDDHDLGLPLDLRRLAEQTASRRRALGWLAGAATACTLIPEETAGPYPGDGSNSTRAGVAHATCSATASATSWPPSAAASPKTTWPRWTSPLRCE